MGNRVDADVEGNFGSSGLGDFALKSILRPTVRKAILSAIIGIVSLGAAGIAFAEETTPPGIEARELPFGTVFTDSKGMSLYIFDNDKAVSKSTCVINCAQTWPPLVAPPDAVPSGPWTLMARPDGAKQWALNGSPLYNFARDTVPGLALGEGILGNWHLADKLAPRPHGVRYYGSALGRVAADMKGMTLYISDKDSAGGQACSAACLRRWIPLDAPAVAAPVGADWSTIERSDDGTRQWTYKGKPVYSYADDMSPGDTNGDGVDKIWHAIVVDPFPPAPGWVTVQPSDYGPIFADAQGRTLYYLQIDLATFEKLACPEDCFRANFTPVLAAEGVSAPGINWTIMKNPDGRMQWAFRGAFIFTFVKDEKPGDIYGDRFGVSTSNGTWQLLKPSLTFPPVL